LWKNYGKVKTKKNAAPVALEAGNSPAMILSNYRELVTPQDAEAWFGIMPLGRKVKSKGKKIVPHPALAAA
jgi:hypothetical protein